MNDDHRVTLERALRELMRAFRTNGEGLLYAELDEWSEPWCGAVAALGGCVGKEQA